MSENTTYTSDVIANIEDLDGFLKGKVSEKRYIHSQGVAATTARLLELYPSNDYPKTWKGFDAAYFCGLSHDIAREMDDASILAYCHENSVELTQQEIDAPVLAHGKVSADIVSKLCPGYPSSWKRAIEVHTTGCAGMDSLALALFVADFIEPSRRFMTDERRSYYLASPNLEACAYRVLCDMMDHWKESGFLCIAKGSVEMKADLEAKGCDEGRFPWLDRETSKGGCRC